MNSGRACAPATVSTNVYPNLITSAAQDNHPISCQRALKQRQRYVSKTPANW
jgi:hypothetical protein